MGLDTKTYWLTDRQSQCDFDFDLNNSPLWGSLWSEAWEVGVRWPSAGELPSWGKSWVVGYSLDSNDMGAEAEKSPLLKPLSGNG
jgi:hypothetical protein